MSVTPPASGQTAQREPSVFRAAGAALRPALRTVAPYVTLGIVVATVFLGVEMTIEAHLKPEEIGDHGWWRLCHIMEHVGAGFLVSSIAVFLYEWGAEAKHLIEITDRLTKFVDSEFQPMLNAVGHEIFHVNLKRLAPSSGNVYESFRSILESFITVEASQAWNKRVYLSFFERSLGQLAKNAEGAAQFAKKRTIARIALPEAASAAEDLLCEQMELLGEGDSYLALSDVDSWRYLDRFLAVQERAVIKRGALIRRIFVIPTMAGRDVGRIIAQHWKLASEWTGKTAKAGRYDICVTTRDALQSFMPKPVLLDKHVGVFCKRSEIYPVAFEVSQQDLSEFTVFAVTEEKKLVPEYEKIWQHLLPQKPVERADIMLASTVRALYPGWTYLVVSDFASWHGLSAFHKACISAIANEHLSIKRVFVRQEADDVGLVRQVLGDHREDSRRRGYEIRLCNQTDATEMFGAEWQFGLFQAPGGRSEDFSFAVTETSSDRTSYYIDTVPAEQVGKRMYKFDEFWDKLPPFTDEMIPRTGAK